MIMENSPHGLHRNGLEDVLSATYIDAEAAKGIKTQLSQQIKIVNENKIKAKKTKTS